MHKPTPFREAGVLGAEPLHIPLRMALLEDEAVCIAEGLIA